MNKLCKLMCKLSCKLMCKLMCTLMCKLMCKLRGGHPAEILHGRDRQFATHYKCNFVLNTWNHASIFRILDKQ